MGNDAVETKGPDPSGDSRDQRIARIVGDCSNRLNLGERVDLEKVIGEHPDLAPDLRKGLEALGRFEAKLKPASLPGHIGEFQILRELGRGGMGIVYEALQISLNRRVALKVLPPNLLSNPRAVARILHEAKVAASLEHPAICTVYDAGVEDGMPYIAMQFIEGVTLSSRLAAGREPRPTSANEATVQTDDREGELTAQSEEAPAAKIPAKREISSIVDLVERAARALHAAHEAGFVHRDIKPGNIMVTPSEEPVILDFGLAQDVEGDKRFSVSGELVGTPAYMSPEQIAAGRIKVDRRTDVYSLGVTLYEGLTSRLPFDAPTREGVFQKILAADPPDPRKLNRNVSRDLKVVLETALEKDVNRRYQTALDFAEDLRRAREYEPIRAKPAGYVVKFKRWVQRNPVVATATVAAFLFLAVGLGVSLGLLSKVREEKQTAQAERDAKAKALVKEKGLRLLAEAKSLVEAEPQLALLLALEGTRLAPGLFASNTLLSCMEAHKEVKFLAGDGDHVVHAAFSPDGRRAVTQVSNKTATVWDVESAKAILTLPSATWHPKFSPDGKRLAVFHGGAVHINDTSSGEEVAKVESEDQGIPTAMHFSPDGRFLLTTAGGSVARISEAETGKQLLILKGHEKEIESARFSLDGTLVVTASADKTARVWDAKTGTELLDLEHESPLSEAELSPDDQHVATTVEDGTLRIFDRVSGKNIWKCESRGNFAFSPGGNRTLSDLYDGRVDVRETSTGRVVCALLGHTAWVTSVVFSGDVQRILTASRDGTARIWSAETGGELCRLAGHLHILYSAGFSPDAQAVITAAGSKGARIWRPWVHGEVLALKGHNASVGATFSLDGGRILTGSDDGTARIWSAADGKELMCLRHEGGVNLAEFSRDGSRIVTASEDKKVRIWDASSGSRILTLDHREPVYRAALSPDGQMVLAVQGDGKVRIWSATSGETVAEIGVPEDRLMQAEFSPDGKSIVTGGEGPARVWEARTGRLLTSLTGHGGPILCVKFSPDGSRIGTGSYDGTARIWEAATGKELHVLRGHQGFVFSVAFSSDGLKVISTVDKTARIWDATTGKEITCLKGHASEVVSGEFNAAGTLAITASFDNTARIWDVATGAELCTLRGHVSNLTSAHFSPDGRRALTASEDGTARVSPVVDLEALAEKCKRRDLTRDEIDYYEVGTGADGTR